MTLRPRITATALVLSLLAVLSLGGNLPGAHASSAGHPGAAYRGPLVNSGWLTVGSDTTYPPMESLDPKTHQYVGADVDLAKALARAMGLRGARIVNHSFDTIIPALQRGNYDIIMSSMNDTPQRKKVINFIDYMSSSAGIVVKSSSNIHANTYAGMCGHAVAVERGTTELDGLTAANKTCHDKITIKAFTADTDAFQAFTSGHADAYTGDLPVAAYYVKQHAGALRLAGSAIRSTENYGIGILYKSSALHQALVKALFTIRHNGAYLSVLKKWGVQDAAL